MPGKNIQQAAGDALTQAKRPDQMAAACQNAAKTFGRPIEHIYLALQWMILSGAVPENAQPWAKDLANALNKPGEWAGFAAVLLAPTALNAIAAAIDKRDEGALQQALTSLSTVLNSPATFGATGALLNVFGLPGAAAMFAVAFAMGTAQSATKLADTLQNPHATRAEKGKAVYDTVTNGFQLLGGCVFGLNVLGLENNPAAANNAQQWVLTACGGLTALQGVWEAAEAVVPPTKTFLAEGGFFGFKPSTPQIAVDDESALLLEPEVSATV